MTTTAEELTDSFQVPIRLMGGGGGHSTIYLVGGGGTAAEFCIQNKTEILEKKHTLMKCIP